MKKWVDMRTICTQLLTPNKTLDPRIFNSQQRMHSDIRNKLIQIAEIVAKKSVLYIPGLKIHDICLRGSSAGYIYHEKSDLDLKIMINSENCNFLTDNPDMLMRFFLQMYLINMMDQKFFINGRLVDIKIEPIRTGEFVGLYSIHNNRWINKPDRNAILSLNVDDVMDKYSKKYYEIKEHLRQISQSGEINTLEGVYALQDYFADMFRLSYTTIDEFMAFKLLQKRGVVNEIRNMLNAGIKSALSI